MAKLKPKEKPHYVNNRDFSEAVYDYAKSALQARTDDIALPIVSNYIATCFIKIAEGLSHRPNFVRYTYRTITLKLRLELVSPMRSLTSHRYVTSPLLDELPKRRSNRISSLDTLRNVASKTLFLWEWTAKVPNKLCSM